MINFKQDILNYARILEKIGKNYEKENVLINE